MATRIRLLGLGRALPWGLATLSVALAFAQRFGRTYTDTRIELTTEPGLFLHRVTSVWSPTVDLGHVQSGQFIGYLFPMGPYFDWTQAVGVPPWIVERVWLAALLWLAGWGTVRLVDALYDRRRGTVHLVAAVLYLANPYVVVQANRATASLLSYAALPWIMLAAHRGLRHPRDWRWPALIALAIAASSGGTNATTVFWIAVAPVALVLYEIVALGTRRRDALAFGWRAGLLALLGSAWWLVPVWIQSKQGPDFLAFTEQPNVIWSTTSMSESLRLMGYWLSYFNAGFGNLQPVSTAVRPYLTSAPAIAATFAVPLMALGGLLVTRRWRYAPFFGMLAVGALLVMAAGYPPSKPAASTLERIYYELRSTEFLRTTYKVGPLLALSLACLAGVAAGALMSLRARQLAVSRSRLVWVAPAVFAPLAILFGLPLFTGRTIEPSFTYGAVPNAWRSAVAGADRATPPDRRIMVLPGQLFGEYRWGRTFEPPIAPVLTRRPVVQRTVDRYADQRSAQLQQAVDDLVQQGRLVPGQLRPLLELMGVGQVIVAADGRPDQSGESPPATIAESLRDQPGLQRAAAAYGSSRRYPPIRGQGGPSVRLPELRRYATPGEQGPGVLRVHPVAGATVLDGDGDGIAALAATGGLDPRRALFYAGDLDRGKVHDLVGQGAALVFSDSNRRRTLTPSLIRGDVGPTLAASDPIPREVPTWRLFSNAGTRDQTVADYGDLAVLRGPAPARIPLAPGSRPYVAFDGRIDTTWLPPQPLPRCVCIDLTLRHPREVAYIRVHPRAIATGAPLPLAVTVNGGRERTVKLSPLGWNRVAVSGRPLRTLRLRIPADRSLLGAFGLDEVQIPGVRVRQALRLPTVLASATRGLNLSHTPIAVELQRTTNDFPFRPASAADRGDPESGIARLVTLPVARRFQLSGWATVSPTADDSALDRLAGVPAGWELTSSSRFEGIPGHRASSAFDGDPRTAWVADFDRRQATWLSVRSPTPFVVRRITLAPGSAEYAFPSQVDVEAGDRTFRARPVTSDGTVVLPRAVRTRSLRLDVTDVATRGASRLLDGVAIGEVRVPGLQPVPVRRQGTFATSCGSVLARSSQSSLPARVSGRLEALDRGSAVRVAGCGRRHLALPAGTALVSASGSTFRPYVLGLRSPAPNGARPVPAPGLVQSPGHAGDGSRSDVRVRLSHPGWLVLAESYSPGWRAWCRSPAGKEHGLGAPRPIDGFANGWRVGSSCAVARFRYAPQRLATASFVVSGLAALAALLLLALPRWRRRPEQRAAPDGSAAVPAPAPVDSVVRLGGRAAVAAGLGLGLVGAWFFAVRAGVVLGLAVAILTFVGVTARRLVWVAIPALAAIPLLYVVAPSSSAGGLFGYANEHLASHWLAVAAVCAIGAACLLDAWRLRRASHRADQRGGDASRERATDHVAAD